MKQGQPRPWLFNCMIKRLPFAWHCDYMYPISPKLTSPIILAYERWNSWLRHWKRACLFICLLSFHSVGGLFYNENQYLSKFISRLTNPWIPYDIWLSNRRIPLIVADEYRRERIYFRYWEHCLFHWASCRYLLHICLLFCFLSFCKRYKSVHSFFYDIANIFNM